MNWRVFIKSKPSYGYEQRFDVNTEYVLWEV